MKSLQTPRHRSVSAKPKTSAFLNIVRQPRLLKEAETIHPTEEDLEEYLYGRLQKHQRKNIESHLDACALCGENLVSMADFVGDLKMAMGIHELCASWPESWNLQDEVDTGDPDCRDIALTMQCIAHDLNNVFQTVVCAANLLSDDPCWAPVSAAILRSIEQGKKITDGFREIEPRSSVLGTIVADAIAFAKDSLIGTTGPEIRFVCDIEPGIELRRSGTWERVLINLFSNAMSAMPAGGTISVSARVCNGFIEIVVCDQGKGIEPEILADLFCPYVSTKVGGGLGLHIVETIVKQDHGEVRAVNRTDGPGASFIITIPLASGARA